MAEPAPLRISEPSARSTPDIRVWAVNSTKVASAGQVAVVGTLREGEVDDRATLGGLVGEAGEPGGVAQLVLPDTRGRHEAAGLPVAVGDGAGLVEQQGADVSGGLDRTARHREHVDPHQAVHAGDPDGRQQGADGGRDQADQQGDQHHDVLRCAGVRRHRGERRDRGQEDQRQARQQDGQGDLVGRLAARGALDQRDHLVEEGLARRRGDADDDPVRQHAGAAGDGAAVAAGLPDDRGRLAGDRRLVDGRDALDDVAVAGDDLAGLDDHAVADLAAGSPGTSDSGPSAASSRATVSVRVARSEAACALPRPSATASARLPKRTVSQSQAAIEIVKVLGSPTAATVVATEPSQHQEHHRRAPQVARVELAEGLRQLLAALGEEDAQRHAGGRPVRVVGVERLDGRVGRGGGQGVGCGVVVMRGPQQSVRGRAPGSR